MALTLADLAAQAMQLPAESRARLAQRLVESLGDVADETQQAWAAEAIRRRDEVRTGNGQRIPAEQVLEEVRRAVGRR